MTATAGELVGARNFLFTDLEGSTRTWERDADAMDRWLAAHDAILTQAIAAGGGHVFKHTGDGLCAVFDSARAAAAAALALQQALAAAGEAAVGPLKVRVALHAGDARERDGDFYGPTLNRCARLLEIAHGGQVLLSGSVATQLAPREPIGPGVVLVDLGQHRLRDLQQPERVWQMTGEGLARGFPPLRSLDAFTHNLPVQRSSFVGRDGETRALPELIAAQRLLTITGVGGCGKTRLALEVAARLLDAFDGGVFFVDLSSQTEPAQVATTILGALQLPPGPGGADERLVDFLRDRRGLLLLDNCEHLLDACAALADQLLSRCSELKILTTSREPLGIDGERVWRVPSLMLPAGDAVDEVGRSEAVRLFVDRAAAVRPGFVLTAENAAAVADICRRLDGIPLAVELAAARVAHLAPREVSARLADRFRLLSGGRRGVQRQQTLQAVLDWSHDLLDEPDRMLLRRLAVFAGGWTLDAAQGVCAGDGLETADVVDLLGALVGRSLVETQDHGDHTRYRLLETVRLYAQDRLLAAAEGDAVRMRHAEWYYHRAVAEARAGPWFPPNVSFDLLADLDNVRQAIDWWRDLGRLDRMASLAAVTVNEFHAQARLDEPEEWLGAALADSGISVALRARCLSAMAIGLEVRGDFIQASERAREAIATAERPEDAGGGYTLLISNLIWADAPEAERLLASASTWASPVGGVAGAFVACLRATLACARHDYARAAALAHEVSEHAEDWGVFTGASSGIVVAALILNDELEFAEAALARLAWKLGDLWPRAYLPLLQAMIDARGGAFAAARERVGESVAVNRRWKIPLTLMDSVLACAAIAFHEGRCERAAELLWLISERTGGALRSPMSMCFFRYYRRAVRATLDPDTIARARTAGAALSLDAALAGELNDGT